MNLIEALKKKKRYSRKNVKVLKIKTNTFIK